MSSTVFNPMNFVPQNLNKSHSLDYMVATEETYFYKALNFIIECKDEFNSASKDLYKTITESANNQEVITEGFSDFFAKIKEIIDKFIKFIKSLFAKFITNLNAAFKREKYLIKHKEDFKKFNSKNEFSFDGYAFSFSPAIPAINALESFTKEFIEIDFNKLNAHIESLLPKKWRKTYKELGERLNNSLRNYIQGLLLVMLLVFITQAVGLTLAGLKAPLIFALFCALTDVIPYFGPYIGAIPAVIVGFAVSPITGICSIVAILVVQLLENNFYQPLIMGHTMKLHPVTIMLGLLIFQHFFGIIGMIVATPVIAAGKVIFTYIDEKINIIGKITGENKN